MDKNKKNKIFSDQFSIHKWKKISESVNKHYIFSKILKFNSSKKKNAFLCTSLIAGRECHWTKKVWNMLGTSKTQGWAMWRQQNAIKWVKYRYYFRDLKKTHVEEFLLWRCIKGMSDPLHLNPKSLNRNAQFEHKYKRSTQSMINHFLKYVSIFQLELTHSAMPPKRSEGF